jgi:hypothetical protein
MVLLGRVTEVVEHHARLHAGAPALRIEREDMVQVFGHIDHDSDVATLPGKTRPAATGQDRSPIAAGDGDGLDHVVKVSGNDDPDGYLAVIRSIGGVERSASFIKSHLTANPPAQLGR